METNRNQPQAAMPLLTFEQQQFAHSILSQFVPEMTWISKEAASRAILSAYMQGQEAALNSAADACNARAVALRAVAQSKIPTAVEVANDCRDSIRALRARTNDNAVQPPAKDAVIADKVQFDIPMSTEPPIPAHIAFAANVLSKLDC